MKTVANLFSTAYTRLGADHQKDRHFMTIERLSPDEDGYGTYVKSVEGLAQNEYWIAREKNILMLLKKTPHVVRLRKEEEKTNNSYQTVKTKDAGISLAHWLRTKPTLAATQQTLKHPLEPAGAFLNLTKYCLIALKGIHQVGVIHANLRADNICIPYAPRPYEFDTEVKLDYEGLTLIDFMFSISSTLKLSRPLPISLTTTPSTQSDMLLMALSEDKKNRNTDFIQRLDYSVDLYALGFILDQIFQQNLRYPEGLDAELLMEIHSFIHELKSYKQGVPDSIKMRFLHLLPHDDYIQRIEHLLSLDYRSANADSQLFTFDPAQFLEDDSLFFTDNGLSLAPESENDQNNEKESDLPLPVSTPIEKTTMKDTMPSSTQTKDISADDSHIEIDKSVVIILIVTAQLLFFVFQEGKSLGLDVSSSMGLILLIGVCAAFAGKLLTPAPAPRLRPIIIEPVTEVLAKEGSNDSNAAVSSKPEMDEFDLIAASVPHASTAVESNDNSHLSIAETVTPEPLANVAEVSLVNEAIVAEVEIPLVETHEADQMVVEEAAEVAPALAVNREATNSNSVTTEHSNVVLLKTESTPPIISAEKDEHIEVNKWAVILAILALQVGFFFLTTDISSPTKPAVATDTPEIAPEVTPAVMPEEVAPVEEAPVEAVGTTDDAGATDIALLSERSSVKMPQPKMTSPAAVTASTLTTENGTPKTKAVATAKEKASKEKPLNETTTATTDNVTETTTTATTAPEKAATPVAVAPATPVAAPTETKTESKPVTTTKSLTQRLAASQNEQGWFYYNGHSSAGIKQDYEEAFKWFQKAANLGEPSAQFNVGMMYAEGKGTKQDFIEAAKWYKKSAEQGKASAQLNLGMMYISGRGIRQNLPEGVKWLNKAADQGDTTAKTNLIWLTQQGYLDNVAAPAADSTNK